MKQVANYMPEDRKKKSFNFQTLESVKRIGDAARINQASNNWQFRENKSFFCKPCTNRMRLMD
jgi:hypothetical protein